jgi:hypothetical protein
MDPMDENLSSLCEDCDKEFAFYGLLEKHRCDVHQEDEVLQCGICGTSFKRKMNLVLHWRSTAHRDVRYVVGSADGDNAVRHCSFLSTGSSGATSATPSTSATGSPPRRSWRSTRPKSTAR